MRNLLLTLFIAACSVSFAQQYQVQESGVVAQKEIRKIKPNGHKAASCSDTVLYTYTKGTSYPAIRLNNWGSARGVAQYFENDQTIRLSGFSFYCYNDSNAAMPLLCRVYSAKPDSAPGTLIYGDTMWIPPVTSYTILANRHRDFFDSVLTITGPFTLVIQNNSASDITAYFNNYNNNDGQGEYRASCRFSNWVRGYNVNIGTADMDADLIVEPYIDYTPVASFITDSICVNTQTPELFQSNSPLISKRTYNASFYNTGRMNSDWNFGDGSPVVYDSDGDTTHQYTVVNDYYPILYDTITGWYGNVCGATDTNLVNDDPAIPGFTYNQVNLLVQFTDTSTGGYAWLWNFGDGNTSTQQNPTHIYASSGTYLVQQFVTGACGTFVATANMTWVGVDKVSILDKVVLFPNPANNQLSIKMEEPEDYEVTIYDIVGNVVSRLRPTEKTTNINTSEWAAGSYLVQLTSARDSRTVKIQITH